MMSTDSYEEAINFAKTFWSEKVQVEHKDSVIFEDARAGNHTETEKLRVYEALKKAASDPADTLDFDMLVISASDMLRDNGRLPGWLASFAADVLEGKRKRPTKRGADKYKNWQRDYALCRTVHEVAKKFDLPMYNNNELSNKTTAAETVSVAVDFKLDVVITACKKFKRMMPYG